MNCTIESLVERQGLVLPPESTVLGSAGNVEPTKDLVLACKDLKRKGFRIVLDVFGWTPGIEPLLELADFIKVDFRSIQSAMVMLGDEMLHRVLTLAIATEWNSGRPPANLHMAFVRARFCELAARLFALVPSEQHFVGILSLLPAVLHVPMNVLTQRWGCTRRFTRRLEMRWRVRRSANAFCSNGWRVMSAPIGRRV